MGASFPREKDICMNDLPDTARECPQVTGQLLRDVLNRSRTSFRATRQPYGRRSFCDDGARDESPGRIDVRLAPGTSLLGSGCKVDGCFPQVRLQPRSLRRHIATAESAFKCRLLLRWLVHCARLSRTHALDALSSLCRSWLLSRWYPTRWKSECCMADSVLLPGRPCGRSCSGADCSLAYKKVGAIDKWVIKKAKQVQHCCGAGP